MAEKLQKFADFSAANDGESAYHFIANQGYKVCRNESEENKHTSLIYTVKMPSITDQINFVF